MQQCQCEADTRASAVAYHQLSVDTHHCIVHCRTQSITSLIVRQIAVQLQRLASSQCAIVRAALSVFDQLFSRTTLPCIYYAGCQKVLMAAVEVTSDIRRRRRTDASLIDIIINR